MMTRHTHTLNQTITSLAQLYKRKKKSLKNALQQQRYSSCAAAAAS